MSSAIRLLWGSTVEKSKVSVKKISPLRRKTFIFMLYSKEGQTADQCRAQKLINSFPNNYLKKLKVIKYSWPPQCPIL